MKYRLAIAWHHRPTDAEQAALARFQKFGNNRRLLFHTGKLIKARLGNVARVDVLENAEAT